MVKSIVLLLFLAKSDNSFHSLFFNNLACLVMNSQDDGLNAINNCFGLGNYCPLQGDNSLGKEISSAVVNRISGYKLEVLLQKQFEHDFNQRATEEKGPSREDLRFMNILEQSAAVDDGHYSLKLPLKPFFFLYQKALRKSFSEMNNSTPKPKIN